jgi:hypothetical protein
MAKGIFRMFTLVFCLLILHCPAHAKSSRTVHLVEGEMAPIYVEPGYSTLLKFDSHPEPGLIGDQDAFKVEYMKNIVAIKPLMPRGKSNLFVFTKDGQFGFQLISSHGKHDNVVYVGARKTSGPIGPTAAKSAIAIDDLLTKKIMKSAKLGSLNVTLESIATPTSRSTIIMKVRVEQQLAGKMKPRKLEAGAFSLMQGANNIKIENVFLENKSRTERDVCSTALILARASDFKKSKISKLVVRLPSVADSNKTEALVLPFSADFR